jgi:glucokinase
MSLIGAVDIGGTKIAVGAARTDGTIVYQCECATEPLRGFPDSMLRIQRMLHDVIDTCGPIEGIGIGCPGPLDPFTGTIGDVGTLPGWQGGNLVEELEKEFRLKVAVENDADAAALAESKWGAGKGVESFFYITISTGIGGGFIVGGKIYRGVQGAHPEIGHMVISDSGPQCYCGARGCWESLASGPATSEWMRGIAPDLGTLTAAEICRRAEEGDEIALSVTRREGYYLGLGLANIITLFAPGAIALGGGVMKSSNLFLPGALDVVKKICTQVPAEKTRIALSSLGARAGLLGASEAWTLRYA